MNHGHIGEIRMFGGPYVPRGWALCDGRALASAEYEALFTVVGTRYGGDEKTFALPDLSRTASAQQGVAYIIYHGGAS